MNLHQREKPDDSARSVALQMKYKSDLFQEILNCVISWFFF